MGWSLHPSESGDNLEGVPEATLGSDCGCRFLHHRSLDRSGLQRFVILFFIELSTRKVEIEGIASSPDGLRMNQVGRNLTDAEAGLLKGSATSSMIAIHCKEKDDAFGARLAHREPCSARRQ
jgi:hypothetical protein